MSYTAKLNKTKDELSVYRHWGLGKADTFNYSILIQHVDLENALAFYVESIQYSDDEEERRELAESMVTIAKKARHGKVWQLNEGDWKGNGSLDLGLDEERRYHSTKAEAIAAAFDRAR